MPGPGSGCLQIIVTLITRRFIRDCHRGCPVIQDNILYNCSHSVTKQFYTLFLTGDEGKDRDSHRHKSPLFVIFLSNKEMEVGEGASKVMIRRSKYDLHTRWSLSLSLLSLPTPLHDSPSREPRQALKYLTKTDLCSSDLDTCTVSL